MLGLVATGVRRGTVAILNRRLVFGTIIVLAGMLVLWAFALNVPGDLLSTYRFSGGGDAVQLPEVPLPTRSFNLALGLIILAMGIYQLVRGFRRTTLAGAIAFLLLMIAFLTWSVRDHSLNLTGLLESTLIRATPFLLGALSGIMCERAGVINIATEGMMLMAAFVSVVVGSITKDLYIALFAGLMSGLIIAGVHAWLSIQFKVDQIISGTVINIFSTGLTTYINLRVLMPQPQFNDAGTFSPLPIPILSQIPVLGQVLFRQNIIVYAALILMFVVHFVLYYTRWGLRTRAVGEHPKAADTLGIDVYKMRYINVLIGGLLAALAGCFLTLGSVGRFDKMMSGGRGFISLAAMIFGNWTPFGAFASSLIFGFADSLQLKLQILTSVIPSEWLLMAPYLATMVVLAGVVGRAVSPAADGKPYEKQ